MQRRDQQIAIGTPTTSYVRSVDLTDSSSLGSSSPEASFSLRATTCVKTPKAGKLRVAITSDDGSRVLIDGRTIIDNWGIHGMIRKEAVEELAAGAHTVTVEYFQVGGPKGLQFEGDLTWDDGISTDIYDVFYSPKPDADDCS